jgi:hypothetical protein
MIKTLWIDSHPMDKQEHLVNGHKLAKDTEKALNELESEGYDIISVTPVISGRYSWAKYDSRITTGFFAKPTVSPDTCASWGYSMTDGIMVTAKKRKN